MSAVAEKEKTELVTVPAKETALEVFKADQGLDPYLKTIRQEVDAFLAAPPSLDTNKGRQAYASMAHKIARSKTAIDGVGKELVADLKELPKKIDAERKRWRDTLDSWRDEVRGPLNKWEAEEEERKARHNGNVMRLIQYGENASQQLESDVLRQMIESVEAAAIDESWEEFEAEAHRAKAKSIEALQAALDARLQYESEQAELARLRAEAEAREQKEREERIAREAAERARQEAEQKAQAERDAAARRELEAKLAAEQREREAREAAESREREHQEALAKAQREAEAERQRIEAEHQRKEQERIAEQRRQEQEAARRKADKEHRASINRAALQAMVDGGMPDDCAKQAITLIAQGRIPNIIITY